MQAAQGSWAIILLHQIVHLGKFNRHLLQQLHPQHDQRQLVGLFGDIHYRFMGMIPVLK